VTATALVPGLSQIDAWDSEHLSGAATFWTTAAQTWDDAFTTVYRDAPFPGGTAWEGEAADAAVLRVGKDRLTVLAAVDALHGAASIARSGASEIQAARQVALKAVNDAQAAGFTVGEDLSVTSRITGGPPAFQAIRHVQAEAFAANIRSQAAALAAVEERIASRISTATAALSSIQFDPDPAIPPNRKPSIQAVDNRIFPQEPPPPPGPEGPLKPIESGQDVKDVLDALEPGQNPPVVTLPHAEEIVELFDHLTEKAGAAPPSDYPGTRRVLSDGTSIGLRPSSTYGGSTIDVVYPDGTKQDVHLPIVTSAPNLPPLADPAPATVPPAQVTHPPVTAVPPNVVATPLLPPWLQDPSPPGFQIAPGKPMTLPWDWDLPPGPAVSVPAPVTTPVPQTGPPLTLPPFQPAPVSPEQAAQAGTATATVGGISILAWLALLLYQN
jgi:hypothetical protein